jgi:hypothetical protein
MRKLLVSTGALPIYTAGVLSAGSVDILQKPVAGQATPFNPLLAGQDISDSDSICFIQGTAAGVNIQTPWIPARDIVRWTGRATAPQVAQVTKVDFGIANIAVAGTASLKLISVGIGQEQFERKTYEIQVAVGDTPTDLSVAFAAAITASLPSFLASAVVNGADLDLTGKISSSVTGQVITSFQTVSPEGLDGSNGALFSIQSVVAPDQGSGDGDLLVDFEKQLQGDRGFYNRITQPNTPVSYIVPATNYDLYSLTYLTGPVGQIKGVDNKREIIIAFDSTAAAGKLLFESIIMPYLGTAPGAFASFSL